MFTVGDPVSTTSKQLAARLPNHTDQSGVASQRTNTAKPYVALLLQSLVRAVIQP